MSGELGKASLTLEADLTKFDRNMQTAEQRADDVNYALDALAAVSKLAEDALKQVKMSPGQGAESKGAAEAIVSGVRGVSEEARTAARELDKVKLGQAQAVESKVAAQEIASGLNEVSRNADQAKRKLAEVRLAGAGNPGAGVGPFGSGFGRIGALGTAVGAGVVTAPTAAPAALGALAALSAAVAPAAVGALGTLALAFDGVGKAISGDKKAFDGLQQSQQQFVLTVRSLDGALDKLKQTAGASLFPGLTEGLKSALSPGTLQAVTRAIQEFGNAIGAAGAAWGRYFGSTEFQQIFGPLMASGARTVSTMSDALLHLFDALGVVLRAATPLTAWMNRAIDDGARFADSWLHAKDASGSLAGAMNEMRSAMQLVGGLFESLVRAVGSLGIALYPVSKIAVKDLTDGLNALAGIIDRNKQTIRDVVSGALAALVATVKTLSPIVGGLAKGLEAVVHAIGGWKTAFEIIISGFLAAKFATLVGSVGKLGQALFMAEGEVTTLRAALLSLSALNPAVTITLIAAGDVGLMKLMGWAGHGISRSFGGSPNNPDATGKYAPKPGDPPGDNAYWTAAQWAQYNRNHGFVRPPATPGAAGSGGHPDTYNPSGHYSQQQIYKLLLANGVPKDVATNLSIISARGEDPSGDIAALNNNANTGDYSVGLFQENFLGKMGVGRVKQYAPQFGLSPTTPVKDFVAWLGKHPSAQAQIAYQIYQSQGYGAWTTAAGLGITGGGTTSPFGTIPPFTKNLGPKSAMPTGANLLPSALRDALQKAKDMATTTQGSTAGHWLQVELADLDKARTDLESQLKGASGKKKAAIQQELRSIDGQIASVNRQITTNLHAQAQAIKTAFSSQISTAKSNISSAMSTLKATLDAQLQANLQTYVDTVLGPKFFQGTDEHGMPLQTPAEAKLAGEQAADTLKSLQDAIDQATDPASRDAAQRQLDEYNDSIAATKERAQADHDYAQAVKTATAAEQEQQRQLNLQLDMFSKGLAAGTTNIADLAGIVGAFGLSLTDEGGIVDDFAALGAAVHDLAAILIRESQALGGVGDDKDAAAAAARAAALNIPKGAPMKIPGTNINFAGFVAAAMARDIPSLDVGGTVLTTGLAMVHRGETYSGVGGGGGVTLQVGPVYGAIDQATARRWAATLKAELDRVIQL